MQHGFSEPAKNNVAANLHSNVPPWHRLSACLSAAAVHLVFYTTGTIRYFLHLSLLIMGIGGGGGRYSKLRCEIDS